MANIPNTYQEVEWLQTEATSDYYFLTDYLGNDNSVFKFKIQPINPENTFNMIYTVGRSYYPNGISFDVSNFGSPTWGTNWVQDANSEGSSDYFKYVDVDVDYEITQSVKNMTISSSTEVYERSNGDSAYWNGSEENPLCICGGYENGFHCETALGMKLYWFKVYEGSTLVKEYIPCYRKSDTVIGLYETVDGEFIEPKNGLGEYLTKGPDVIYSYYDAHYIGTYTFDNGYVGNTPLSAMYYGTHLITNLNIVTFKEGYVATGNATDGYTFKLKKIRTVNGVEQGDWITTDTTLSSKTDTDGYVVVAKKKYKKEVYSVYINNQWTVTDLYLIGDYIGDVTESIVVDALNMFETGQGYTDWGDGQGLVLTRNFRSCKSKGITDAQDFIKVTFEGYQNFKFKYRSNGENCCDYLIIFDLDYTPDQSQHYNYDSANVFAHTKNKSQTNFFGEFTNLDGNEHFFYAVYRKDGSGDFYQDNGIIAFKEEDVTSYSNTVELVSNTTTIGNVSYPNPVDWYAKWFNANVEGITTRIFSDGSSISTTGYQDNQVTCTQNRNESTRPLYFNVYYGNIEGEYETTQSAYESVERTNDNTVYYRTTDGQIIDLYGDGAWYDADENPMWVIEHTYQDESSTTDYDKIGVIQFPKDCYRSDQILIYNNEKIEWIRYPNSLTSISCGQDLEDCINLEDVRFGENIQEVGSYFCRNCSSLKHIEFKGSIPTFGDGSFEGVPSQGTIYCKAEWEDIAYFLKDEVPPLADWTIQVIQ